MPKQLTEHEELLASAESDDAVELVRKLYYEAAGFYADDHAAIGEDLAFALDMDHYRRKSAPTDPFGFQPKMPDLYNLNRHKAARIAAAEIYPSTFPVDEGDDPETAEDARRVLELEMETKRFRPELRRAVAWAVNGRIGVLELEILEGASPFGAEIHPRAGDPRMLFVAPGFLDPHDPLCPWVMKIAPMQVREVRARGSKAVPKGARWNVSGELTPDGEANRTAATARDPSAYLDIAGVGPAGQANIGGDIVWVAFLWHKLDRTMKVERTQRKLPEELRHMICPQCGAVDELQGLGMLLPEVGAMCPECGTAATERVDEVIETDMSRAYPKGRLIICAINQPWLKPFYDGDWPKRTLPDGTERGMRSFPFAIIRVHEDPRRLIPVSDTFIHSDELNMVNATFRSAFWQMVRNRDWILTLPGGLVDGKGQPFEPTDSPEQVFLYAADQLSASMTRQFQGSGVSPGFATFLSAVKQSFQATQGTSDLSAFTQEAKDVPVGTVRQYVRSGEVPIDDAVDLVREALGPFLGVWLDLWVITTTEAKAVRYFGPDGILSFKRLEAADIPQVDVVVSANPRLDVARVDEAERLLKVLSTPEPIRSTLWEILNLPKSKLAEFNQREQEAMQQAAATQAQGPQLSPALASRLTGPSGAGGIPGESPNGG